MAQSQQIFQAKKKKKKYDSFQQTSGKAEEEGLPWDQHNTLQRVLHAGAVVSNDGGKELIHDSREHCVCPDKH